MQIPRRDGRSKGVVMEIQKTASAGTTEKCDCLVTVSKGSGGRTVELKSKVLYEYGDRMVALVHHCLTQMGIQDALVEVEDMGAFDHILVARLQAAVYRSQDKTENIPWGELLYES